MAKQDNLPFAIGTTFFDGQTPDTAVAVNLEGKCYQVEDLDYSVTSGPKSARSARLRTVMVVRNSAGIALLPKRLVKFKETAGNTYLGQVDGYCHLGYADTGIVDYAVPVDEFLPSAGAPSNDLFYVVIDGPAMVITALANMGADVAVGDYVVHATAASSQATTAGRVTTHGITAANTGTVAIRETQRQIGRALSSKITTDTNTSLWVDIKRWC